MSSLGETIACGTGTGNPATSEASPKEVRDDQLSLVFRSTQLSHFFTSPALRSCAP